MKTLLAIINEPVESKDFIQYAANMAFDLNANVHLLYVQNTNAYPLGTVGTTGVASARIQQNTELQSERAKETMNKYIVEVKSKMSDDVLIDYSSELGITSLIAKKLVSEEKVDMVVLENQENESFWTQTSHNMDIISNVDCPVWVVPKDKDYKPFTEIIYATDYHEEDITNLKKLIALTQHYSPSITALHITDSVDFEEKVIKAGFKEMLQEKASYDHLSVKVLNESNGDNMANLLNDYALLINAELIVVLKENKSFLEKIFKTDHTKKIIEKSMLPVLVLHEKK